MELVSERGGTRIWKIDENTYREQRMEVAIQTMQMSMSSRQSILALAQDTLMDEVTSRAVSLTDEDMIAVRFSGWKNEMVVRVDESAVFEVLVGEGRVYYWPRMEEA